MDLKSLLKKIWYFIWKDDSLLSWIVNVILAFLLVKFIVYPGLGFLLSTSHPLVAVVSSSMEHDASFNEWWQSQSDWYEDEGITKEEFKEYHFKNGFNKGDIMVLYGTSPQNIKIGDVIVFKTSQPDPIIHRVVGVTKESSSIYFQTKGDNNPDSIISLGENRVSSSSLIGRAVIRIPFLGWVKIIFTDIIQIFR